MLALQVQSACRNGAYGFILVRFFAAHGENSACWHKSRRLARATIVECPNTAVAAVGAGFVARVVRFVRQFGDQVLGVARLNQAQKKSVST
nr:hypothetical protein [Deefgea sp. CFH1-16]